MSNVLIHDSSSHWVASAARWLGVRAAAYLGVAVVSGALFFASVTIYAYLAPQAPDAPPHSDTQKGADPQLLDRPPEPTPAPVKLPPPANVDPPIPMAVAPPPVPKVPDARVLLAGADKELATSDLYQKAVLNGKDKSAIGTVAGFQIANGKVQSVIVSIGGFLGAGSKDIAVPLDKVMFDKAGEWHLLLNESKDSLKAAPEFKYEPERGWVPIESALPSQQNISGPKPPIPPVPGKHR